MASVVMVSVSYSYRLDWVRRSAKSEEREPTRDFDHKP